MSSWTRTPAPVGGGTREWWSGACISADADEDASAIDALETRLAQQREAVRTQQAPEPVGGAIAGAIAAARAHALDDDDEDEEEGATPGADYEDAIDDEDVDPARAPTVDANAFDVPDFNARFEHHAVDDSEQPISAELDVTFP